MQCSVLFRHDKVLGEVAFYKEISPKTCVKANQIWSMQTLATLYSYPDILNIEPKTSTAPSKGADLVFELDNFPHGPLFIVTAVGYLF